MITGKDVNEELRNGIKKFKEVKTTEEKVKVLFKLVTVLIKLCLTTRTNTVLIMDKLGVKKIESKKREETKPKDKGQSSV